MANIQSERIKLMKDGFIPLRKEGKTIAEIAEHFQVSTVTVYHYLQEIADANSVSRDSLLYVVHKPHELKNGRVTTHFNPVDPNELNEKFISLQNDVDEVISLIDEALKEKQEEE